MPEEGSRPQAPADPSCLLRQVESVYSPAPSWPTSRQFVRNGVSPRWEGGGGREKEDLERHVMSLNATSHYDDPRQPEAAGAQHMRSEMTCHDNI